MSELACRSCGALLAKPKAGQRQFYCSAGCRKSAEYEIRRVNRRLESLETSLSSMRINPRDEFLEMIDGRTHSERVAAVEAELAILKARFRELLDDGPTPERRAAGATSPIFSAES
ncbi:MAG: hypothetical protein ACREV4_15545 [Gammaproteobacteria bacterium]